MQLPSTTTPVCGVQHSRLDTYRLDQTVQSLFVSGLATSMHQTYSSGQCRYSLLRGNECASATPACPSRLEVRIKASKTDPFRLGVLLFIGRVASDLFPVSAMLAYLVARGKGEGPLFRFSDGRPLTRQRLVSVWL